MKGEKISNQITRNDEKLGENDFVFFWKNWDQTQMLVKTEIINSGWLKFFQIAWNGKKIGQKLFLEF